MQKGEKMNKQEMIEIIKELDPKVKEKDSEFLSALILLSALEVGTEAHVIAEFLDVPYNKVTERTTKLHDNGVFVDGAIHCEWMDEKTGGIAFWLDVAIAEGYVERVSE